MAAGASIKIDGLKRLTRTITVTKDAFDSGGVIDRALARGAQLVRDDAVQRAPKFIGPRGGKLSQSIVVKPGHGEATVRVNDDTGKAMAVEFGRRPGKGVPTSGPRGAALRRWAEHHGIEPFLVARAIKEKGIKARPFLVPALLENKDRVVRVVGNHIAKLLGGA